MNEIGKNLFGSLLVELIVVVLAIIVKDDKKKVALILLIGTILAAAIGFIPFSSIVFSSQVNQEEVTQKSPTTESPSLMSDYPHWAQQVGKNPIIPGVGLAGIELGFTEDQVVELLGEATEPTITIVGAQNEPLFYAFKYQYKDSGMTVNVTVDTRIVEYITIWDNDQIPEKFIPSINGITIGDLEENLKGMFGDPITIYNFPICPLDSKESISYDYSGIGFEVCKSNSLIFQIDIFPK